MKTKIFNLLSNLMNFDEIFGKREVKLTLLVFLGLIYVMKINLGM